MTHHATQGHKDVIYWGVYKFVILEGCRMLWTIFVVLLVLWLVGLVSFHAIGAYIHILLVLAVVVLLIQLITGRRSAL